MKNRPIVIYDSGIGGFSLLIELKKLLPYEHYVYFGDNDNAPYGNMDREDLKLLVIKNCRKIKRLHPKVVVIACNTLSTNFMTLIESEVGVKCFGVFPPIDNVKGKTLLLATKLTCDNYKNVKNLTLCPLSGLAGEIESNKFNLNRIDIVRNLDFSAINDEKNVYTTVILGCTHYFFVKNEIIDHFCPQKILYGELFTAKEVYNFLTINKLLVNYRRFRICFFGKCAKLNKKFYKKVVKATYFDAK